MWECGNLSTLPYLLSPGRSVQRESDLSLTASNQTWCNSGFGHALPQSLNEIIFFPCPSGQKYVLPKYHLSDTWRIAVTERSCGRIILPNSLQAFPAGAGLGMFQAVEVSLSHWGSSCVVYEEDPCFPLLPGFCSSLRV